MNTVWILSILVFGIATVLERYFSMVARQKQEEREVASQLSLYSEVLESNLIDRKKLEDKKGDNLDKQIRKLEKEIVRRDLEIEVLKEKKAYKVASRPVAQATPVAEAKPVVKKTQVRTIEDLNLLDLL